ncbi:MAG: serine/threonine-protein kinase [Acidobacteriota bacterium]
MDPAETTHQENGSSSQGFPAQAIRAATPGVGRTTRPEDFCGRRVGRYRLIRPLGSGGMGTVYLAERDDGVLDQQVALKILRPDQASDVFFRRFDDERRILASLEHPHIARFYDGGTTDGGLPYLAMEYVDGLPITEHCEALGLDLGDRLRLFLDVCGAVQAAHQALVVHRDLKPSNILVTHAGQVKLLDFGIAKPLASLDQLTRTEASTGPMTPAFASPEQIRGEPVTTASDAYALGVLLYRLLSGRFPHPVGRGVAASVCATLEDTPPPLSAAADGDAHRLRGDLDAIAARALAKSAGERYATARELADDVERHLSGLPVRARSAGWLYAAGKFMRRRAPFVATVAGCGLVVTFLVAIYTVRLAEERDRASAEAANARAVQGFVLDLFELADPDRAGSRGLDAVDLLDAGRERLADLDAEPAIRARVQLALAELYGRLGTYGPAELLLEEAAAALRNESHAVELLSDTLFELGVLRRRQGRYAEARELQLESKRLSETHLPASTDRPAQNDNELGLLAWSEGQYPQAERLHRRTLETRRRLVEQGQAEPQSVASSLNNLAMALVYQGRNLEALPMLEEALAIRRRVFGEGHTSVMRGLNNLALVHGNLDRRDMAAELYRDVLAKKLERYGAEHPSVASGQLNLAAALANLGRYGEAVDLGSRAFETRRHLLGPGHPDTLVALTRLGVFNRQLERYGDAELHLREALGRHRASERGAHPELALTLHQLGAVLLHTGRLEDAADAGHEALALNLEFFGEAHPRVDASRRLLERIQTVSGVEP